MYVCMYVLNAHTKNRVNQHSCSLPTCGGLTWEQQISRAGGSSILRHRGLHLFWGQPKTVIPGPAPGRLQWKFTQTAHSGSHGRRPLRGKRAAVQCGNLASENPGVLFRLVP